MRWPKYWSFSFRIMLPNNIQVDFLYNWLVSSKGHSRVFFSNTIQKHLFYSAQLLFGPAFTYIHQLSSVVQLCPIVCDPMDCSTPGYPVYHQLPQLLKHEFVMPSNHPILCHPLLLPLSIFPSIRVFSKESVLCIRCPKYWSFSFNISHSNEHLGLISF